MKTSKHPKYQAQKGRIFINADTLYGIYEAVRSSSADGLAIGPAQYRADHPGAPISRAGDTEAEQGGE